MTVGGRALTSLSISRPPKNEVMVLFVLKFIERFGGPDRPRSSSAAHRCPRRSQGHLAARRTPRQRRPPNLSINFSTTDTFLPEAPIFRGLSQFWHLIIFHLPLFTDVFGRRTSWSLAVRLRGARTVSISVGKTRDVTI